MDKTIKNLRELGVKKVENRELEVKNDILKSKNY